MRKIFLVVLFSLCFQSLRAQLINYSKESQDWFEGVVYLETEERIKVLINYNFVVDHLKIKRDGKESVLLPRKVISFKYKDSVNIKEFLSLSYDYDKSGRKADGFFQVIHQNSHYLLLSKHIIDFTKQEQGALLTLTGGVAPGKVNIINEKVSEMIFLMDREGNLMACLEKKKGKNSSIQNSKIDKTPQKSLTEKEIKKYKLLEKRVFEDFFDAQFRQFNDYVEINNLNIRTLEGLIQALDFQE
jgi:hypothetical protein